MHQRSNVYPERHEYVDRTFDAMARTHPLRQQLRFLYVGAATAAKNEKPFTYADLGWLLECMLYSTTDLYTHEEQTLLLAYEGIRKKVSSNPENGTQDPSESKYVPEPIDFKHVAELVHVLDPQLYKEVSRALPSP